MGSAHCWPPPARVAQVDVLHAQAGDVREAQRRELIETGARKEVVMMMPVVFLILPVTVVTGWVT
ncbi:MAG: hypothetical protein H0V23_10115 [Nocardioidaceae bacterium]|nr:hypothetical protein [Nocardioidaceae bacterium]